jgi:hypothetical protein
VTTFCFNDPELSGWPSPGASNCYMTMGGQYRRIATFSATVVAGFVNQIAVSVSVDWKDGNKLKSVPIQSVFSIWE